MGEGTVPLAPLGWNKSWKAPLEEEYLDFLVAGLKWLGVPGYQLGLQVLLLG
jgi:hypothetical protein